MGLEHSKFGILLYTLNSKEAKNYIDLLSKIETITKKSVSDLNDIKQELEKVPNNYNNPENDMHKLIVDEFLDICTFGEEKIDNYIAKLDNIMKLNI